MDDNDIVADLPDAADVDEPALRRMKAVARILDGAVRVPGTDVRVGVDPLLGAIPGGVGDVISAGFSLYIVLEAANLGVPYATVVRMLANVGIDVAVGSVPVVGVLFDALWRANERNVELVERHLDRERGWDRSDSRTDAEVEDAVVIEVEEQ